MYFLCYICMKLFFFLVSFFVFVFFFLCVSVPYWAALRCWKSEDFQASMTEEKINFFVLFCSRFGVCYSQHYCFLSYFIIIIFLINVHVVNNIIIIFFVGENVYIERWWDLKKIINKFCIFLYLNKINKGMINLFKLCFDYFIRKVKTAAVITN